MPSSLESLAIRGFRSIRALEAFPIRPLNVMIGPNGAGKSNLVDFFRFLRALVAPGREFGLHIAKQGGAASLIFDGPKQTPKLSAELWLGTDDGEEGYRFQMAHGANDTLVIEHEMITHQGGWRTIASGDREANLADFEETVAVRIHSLLMSCEVHQFHDTSPTSRIRRKWSADDFGHLKEDAGNLAPFLLRLRDERPPWYRRIVEAVRSVLPFFADFVLEPDGADKLLLRWSERGTDEVFSVAQASDGMLRAMALFALLLQPEEDLPSVLILDEPELGLHPQAISAIAGLIRGVSHQTQVIVATQSADLLNEFAPEDVVVVQRDPAERYSRFDRLSSEELGEWLDEYTLAELWHKNVLGGRP